jgi:cytochrome b
MKTEIKVWDGFVRIFHWLLVLLFITAYVTGDEKNNLHLYSGYAILGLIVLRIIWGFIGSKYAKFTNFIYSPTNTINYFKNIKNKNAKHYIGHNPAGGWMIILMIISLLIVIISGIKVDEIEKRENSANNINITFINNAYADDDDENHAEEEFWEEIHEISANFMILLIILHVLGVIAASRLHNENLVKAMITGKK